jgi:tetratricopeptide (TPR) repeat protein
MHAVGEFDEALACFREALEIDRGLSHEGDVARHLGNIGAVLQDKGDFVNALSYFEQALPRLRAVGSKRFVLGPLLGQAEVLLAQERHLAEAKEVADEALELALGLGNHDFILKARVLTARVSFASGDEERGYHKLRALLPAHESPEDQARLHYELWRMGRDDSHRQAAVRLYQELYGRIPSHVHKTRLEELVAFVPHSTA